MTQPSRVTLHVQIQQLRREIQRLVEEERTYNQVRQVTLEKQAAMEREEFILNNDFAALNVLSSNVTDLADEKFQASLIANSWDDTEQINDRATFGAALKSRIQHSVESLQPENMQMRGYPRTIPLTVNVGHAQWDVSIQGALEDAEPLTVRFRARDTVEALAHEITLQNMMRTGNAELSQPFEHLLHSIPNELQRVKQNLDQTQSSLCEVAEESAPWPGRAELIQRRAQLARNIMVQKEDSTIALKSAEHSPIQSRPPRFEQ